MYQLLVGVGKGDDEGLVLYILYICLYCCEFATDIGSELSLALCQGLHFLFDKWLAERQRQVHESKAEH